MSIPAQHEHSEPTRHDGFGKAGRKEDRTAIARIASDTLHVRRVFGEPIRDGEVTLVPVATIIGSSGSGYAHGGAGAGTPSSSSSSSSSEDSLTQSSRTSGAGSGSAGGGGFAVRVKPVGVYVVRGADVSWRPAVDVSRAILGGQVAGAVAFIALALALRRRRR